MRYTSLILQRCGRHQAVNLLHRGIWSSSISAVHPPRWQSYSRKGLESGHQYRSYSEGIIASFLSHVHGPMVPPVILVGLAITLWTMKCVNMVVFQNKIIYMPYMPPFARSEKIEAYQSESGPVDWHEERIVAADGTSLSLCVGELPLKAELPSEELLLLYFQG